MVEIQMFGSWAAIACGSGSGSGSGLGCAAAGAGRVGSGSGCSGSGKSSGDSMYFSMARFSTSASLDAAARHSAPSAVARGLLPIGRRSARRSVPALSRSVGSGATTEVMS